MATDRRRRRLQRLTILFLAFVVLAGGVAGLWVFQQQRQEQRKLALRTEGLAAYEAGDDATAAARLGDYVDATPDAEPEVLLAAAEAALRLPLTGDLHIRRAQQWLLRLRQDDPKNDRANDLLLEIAETRQSPEQAVRVAGDILADNPDNQRARLLRAGRLLVRDEPARAMEDLDHHLERHPGDAEGELLRVQARLAMQEPAAEVAAGAAQAVEEAEDPAEKPGLRLAAAYAKIRADRPAEALELLQAAAAEPPVDPKFTVRVARLLDAVNAFPEANAYLLENAAAVPVDTGAGLEVTRRLFEAGNLNEVADRLAGLTDRSAPELLAIQAMTLSELGRSGEAGPALEKLKGHADPAGARWAAPLELFYADPRVPAAVLEAARASVDAGLRHPYLLALMGRSQAEVDDHASALSLHREAAQGRPAWAAPHVLASRSLLELGRPAEAEAEANEAFLRRRDLLEPLVLKAEAMAQLPGREAGTLELVRRLREQAPDQARLIVLEASALAAAGRADDARAAIEAAVARTPPLPPADLLELARVGQAAGLDTETLVLDRLNDAYGDRPELVFANATRMARGGDVAGGLALIRDSMDPEQPSWRLIEAAYLQLANDPGATAAWAAVSDDFPDRLDVQRRVLESPAAAADRGLADRVIARVRELAGESNLSWRLARARWLLEAPDADAAARVEQAREAQALLDEVLARTDGDAEALLLRARAHERQDNLVQAVRDAEAALQRGEPRPATRLEAARLQQAVGNFPAALSNLVAVADAPAGTLTPSQHRAAALLLAGQGEYGRSIALLESLRAMDAGGAIEGRDLLILAQLYAQVGRNADAEAVLGELLASSPSPETLTWAAGFYAESGRPADANEVLGRLEEAGMPAAERRATLAAHAARYGSLQEALSGYEAAAAAGDPGAAARLAAFNLNLGRGQAAVDAARAGLAAGQTDPGLSALVARADEVVRLAPDPAYRPTLTRLLQADNRAARETLSAAIRLCADAGLEPREKLSRLRATVREEGADLAELQTLAAQLHLRAGMNEDALALAEAAAIAHPNEVAPAQARALAFFALERWDDALASALDWRRRSARDPLAADLLIARSQLAKGQPREAEAALRGYREFAAQVPEQMADFAAVYGRALAEMGRDAEAVALIQPHLGLPDWRAAGVAITASIRDADRRSDWLEALTAAVPEDRASERFRLANAWWALHLFGDSTARDAPDAGRLALRIVSDLARRPDATMPVHAAAGMMSESLGEREQAAAFYRKALELEPGAAAVRNNLAMVLLGAGDTPPLDAAGGLRLAREAVSASPDDPNYRDTLALALVKTGELDEALETIEVAIDLDPGNPVWRERQAEIMALQ